MQQVNTPLACDTPSQMVQAVLDYLDGQKQSTEMLATRIGVPVPWLRALRERRSRAPDVNRVEYIFRNFCGGTLHVTSN